jgi:flagellar export protein FliJ
MNNKKTLKNLALLSHHNQQKTEEVGLEIQTCLQVITEIEQGIDKLKEQNQKEEALASQMEEGTLSLTLQNYRIQNIAKMQIQLDELVKKQQEYLELSEKLKDLFSEHKAFEIGTQKINAEIARIQNKEEQNFIDEIASRNWQKKID